MHWTLFVALSSFQVQVGPTLCKKTHFNPCLVILQQLISVTSWVSAECQWFQCLCNNKTLHFVQTTYSLLRLGEQCCICNRHCTRRLWYHPESLQGLGWYHSLQVQYLVYSTRYHSHKFCANCPLWSSFDFFLSLNTFGGSKKGFKQEKTSLLDFIVLICLCWTKLAGRGVVLGC